MRSPLAADCSAAVNVSLPVFDEQASEAVWAFIPWSEWPKVRLSLSLLLSLSLSPSLSLVFTLN